MADRLVIFKIGSDKMPKVTWFADLQAARDDALYEEKPPAAAPR